jgi:hypothetical protein
MTYHNGNILFLVSLPKDGTGKACMPYLNLLMKEELD